MRHILLYGFGLLLGLGIFSTLNAVDRVVLCEDYYQED